MRSSDFFVGRKNKRVWKHKHETLKKMRFVSWFCRITVAKIRLNGRSFQSWLYDGACSGLGKNRAPAFHAICFHYTCSLSWPVPLCYTLFSFYLFLFLSFLMLFFVSSFLFLCYSLFFSFYHLLLCNSLFFIILSLSLLLFFVSSFYSYVNLCFFLLSPSLM